MTIRSFAQTPKDEREWGRFFRETTVTADAVDADTAGLVEAIEDTTADLITDGTGITWAYNDAGRTLTGTVSLTPFSTSNLAEGTNLYFTTERAQDATALLITNGTGLTWTYDDALNTLTGVVSLAPFSTTDLAEGSNLYFTDERAQDAVGTILTNGGGLTWTYNDAGNTISAAVSLASFSTTNLSEGSNLYFTDERAQDAVGTILANSSRVTLTYSDATPSITADLVAASVANSYLANMAQDTIKGRTSGAGTGDPVDLTAAQVATIVSAAVASALNITSGTYTPTLTNVTNLDASTAFDTHYLRVGSTVVVSGQVNVDPTALASTELGISLPIASNIGAGADVGGAAYSNAVAQGAGILGDSTNDRARMVWVATDTTNRAMFFCFAYQVI